MGIRGIAIAWWALVLVAACSSPSQPGVSRTEPSVVSLPPAGVRFSYQLGGPYDPPAGVGIIGRDRTAAPVAALYSICYVNAFQAQADAVTWWEREYPELLLRNEGRVVVDEQWGEPLLDTSDPVRLIEVTGPWVDTCARDGFDAVELDNLDSFTRSQDRLTAADALHYGRLLTERAHANGIAAAQKNAAELSVAARRAGFDFAVAEECQTHVECDEYTAVYGTAFIEVEYTDQDAGVLAAACRARGERVSVVRRDRELTPAGVAGHVEQWC